MQYIILTFQQSLYYYMGVKFGDILIPLLHIYKKENLSVDTIYSRILCEKLHTKFCKYILGIEKVQTLQFCLNYDVFLCIMT